MAQLMLWDCEELTPDAAALCAQQLVTLMAELAGHPVCWMSHCQGSPSLVTLRPIPLIWGMRGVQCGD